jgi:hypothetical protein
MNRFFPYLVLTAAFILAGSAAYYSVFGLSKLFSSQSLAVIILAGSLESAKLITATYLHRYWSSISMFIKTYMIIAVIVLMSITSLGIYGFLVSAYQTTAYDLEKLNSVTTTLQTKKSRFESQLANADKATQSIDKNMSVLTTALSNNVIKYTDANGNQVVKTSNENRKAYQSQLLELNTRLSQLNLQQSQLSDSITKIDMRILDLKTNSKVAAEIGPLKYISEISGLSMDVIVNWLIILLIIVFDPLAIILLISANHAFNLKPETNLTSPKVLPATTNSSQSADVTASNSGILSYWNKLRNNRKI